VRGYAIRKLLSVLVIVPVVTLCVFLMRVLVPGDPVEIMFMGQSTDRETIERVRRELGWDRPILTQYADYLRRLARGDLGRSIQNGRPVAEDLRARYPLTLLLAVASLAVAVSLGLALGVLAALHRERLLDAVATALAVVGISMPPFWLGLLLIGLVSVRWGLLPVMGAESWRHLVLPALTLGAVSAAAIARLVRSSLLETLGQDFVRTAWAKGLAGPRVVVMHALRAALGPVLSIVGLQFGFMLSGAFIVEVVFAWHGVGELAVIAIQTRDFPVIQAVVVTVAATYVLLNAAVDVASAWVDPRVRVA
jgi:peptide/nickel transport system permease protein/oligopeptide transport system permease protein